MGCFRFKVAGLVLSSVFGLRFGGFGYFGFGFVDFGSCTDFGVRDWYKTGFDENLIFVGFVLMVEF